MKFSLLGSGRLSRAQRLNEIAATRSVVWTFLFWVIYGLIIIAFSLLMVWVHVASIGIGGFTIPWDTLLQ